MAKSTTLPMDIEEEEDTMVEQSEAEENDEEIVDAGVEETEKVEPAVIKKPKKRKPSAAKKTKTSKTKTRQSVKNVKQDEFMDLYAEQNESDDVDMTKMDRKKKRNMLALLAGLVVMLSIIAIGLGYIVFGNHQATINQSDIKFTVTAPVQVGSGDEVMLKLHYANNSSVAIDHGTVQLLPTPGFTFVSADPQPTDANHTQWAVPGLAAGAEGTIQLTGQLIGQVGDIRNFNATFTYTPVNFNSNFQTNATAAVTVQKSIIQVTATAPKQAALGDVIDYKFEIKNTSEAPLINAQAMVNVPSDFQASKATPTANQDTTTWLFDKIQPGETKKVDLQGSFVSNSSTSEDFAVQVGFQQTDGFFNSQAQATATVQLNSPKLNLKITGPKTAQVGDKVSYAITVANPANVTLTNVQLNLTFTAGVFAEDQASLAAITTINPNQTITINQAETVSSTLPDSVNKITANLAVASALVNNTAMQFTQTSSVDTTIAGGVTFNGEGRYYDTDNTALGSGPIPPQVGKTTAYDIRWTIQAANGDMKNIQIKTVLPAGVTFASTTLPTGVTYNSDSNTVQYSLDQLTNGATQTIDWLVSITPQASDANKVLILTNQANLTATDVKSGASVPAQVGKITTNIKKDTSATGSGVVVQ